MPVVVGGNFPVQPSRIHRVDHRVEDHQTEMPDEDDVYVEYVRIADKCGVITERLEGAT